MTTRDGLSVGELLIANRRIPCICDRQDDVDTEIRDVIAIDDRSGLIITTVACGQAGCGRRWKRIG